MTGQRRQTIAHAVIALAACAGAYYMLVDPVRQQLRDVSAKVAECEAHSAQMQSLAEAMPAVNAALKDVEARRAWFEARNAQLEDRAALFGRISELAALHRVTVDQLTPTEREITHEATVGANGAPGAGDSGAVKAVRYSLTVTASYADLAEYLVALQGEAGFVRVLSVRVAPLAADGAPVVVATIETEHFAFDASPAEIVATGETGANP